jgi:hypothetical protein
MFTCPQLIGMTRPSRRRAVRIGQTFRMAEHGAAAPLSWLPRPAVYTKLTRTCNDVSTRDAVALCHGGVSTSPAEQNDEFGTAMAVRLLAPATPARHTTSTAVTPDIRDDQGFA